MVSMSLRSSPNQQTLDLSFSIKSLATTASAAFAPLKTTFFLSSSPEVKTVTMLRFAVIACVLAVVSADCGLIARQVVKGQWAKAFATANDRSEFGQLVWNNVFHTMPEARDLFERVRGDNVHSPQFRAHAQRVLSGLDQCVGLLDDPSALRAQLAHLKVQHATRGVEESHMAAFKSGLMDALASANGLCFNQDVWDECLDDFMAAIKSA